MRKRKNRRIVSLKDGRNENDRLDENLDEEGFEMSQAKKHESNIVFDLGHENPANYNWVVFELENNYYMGFESEVDLQAVKISEKFYNDFQIEFGD